jgi:hypothetical protein
MGYFKMIAGLDGCTSFHLPDIFDSTGELSFAESDLEWQATLHGAQVCNQHHFESVQNRLTAV